jgi:hypothetical protein
VESVDGIRDTSALVYVIQCEIGCERVIARPTRVEGIAI